MVTNPWDSEPESETFIHEGIRCILVRQRLMKYWMMYVVVGRGHPWFGSHPAELAYVPVHGKVAYADVNPFVDTPNQDDWWVGAYCGHAFDLIPYFYEQDYHNHPRLFRHDVYRDLEFVRKEVRTLAEFAKEANVAEVFKD